MHFCEICNYITTSLHDYKRHLSTLKHKNIDIGTISNKIYTNEIYTNEINLICLTCNKKYIKQRNLENHAIKCQLKKSNDIALIKNKLKKLQLQNQSLELKIINNTKNINNIKIDKSININTINNNISKIENLNINFGDVIDINTFIDNYKNQYGLTNKQTEILLENYKNGGINSCISSLVYYLKESAIQQYKEIKGKDIPMSDIILPFILSDKCIRDHFEKNDSGKWDKTIVVDNIKKIVGITDDHVYKHHNTHLQLNDQHKKKLINGVLKSSDYSKLNLLSKPNLYKTTEENTNVKLDIEELSLL
jgi:hypothetical protein